MSRDSGHDARIPVLPMAEATWLDLSDAQGAGHACVVCSRDYRARVPLLSNVRLGVGLSRTGQWVNACDGPCYSLAVKLLTGAVAAATFDPAAPVVVTGEARAAVLR